MTNKRHSFGARLANYWTRLSGFLDAMDPDPLSYNNDRISRLQDEISGIISRIERLESSTAKHS